MTALSRRGGISGRLEFIVMEGLFSSCGFWVVIPRSSRLLGPPYLSPLFVSAFLCFSIMWVEIIVSVLVLSSVSDSGVTV